MTAEIAFFPVSNGDMTLFTLDNGQTILIDVNIRAAADDAEDDTPDVAPICATNCSAMIMTDFMSIPFS